MATTAYMVGAFTSLACALLLLRGYLRVRQKLLLWSGVCFALFAIGNLLIFVDLVVLPQVDLYPLRLGIDSVAMVLLLYGLIWESG